MQPELQIAHRVTAEVLQLQTQTTQCVNFALSSFVATDLSMQATALP